ncbi:MAG: hypothetical protein K2O84_03895 [Oscillospiraceae bacterium]|nr:hypothetical protein [Oscillospiraceae bacterium]
MKKRVFTVFTALLCLLALAGCKTVVEDGFDIEDVAKAQKIVVADASGTEKAVLDTEADIDAFVDAINIDEWKLAELPEGLEKQGSFALWQNETVKAFIGKGETRSLEVCTFIIYDQDYLTIDTGVMDIVFTFKLSESAAAYLRELAA